MLPPRPPLPLPPAHTHTHAQTLARARNLCFLRDAVTMDDMSTMWKQLEAYEMKEELEKATLLEKEEEAAQAVSALAAEAARPVAGALSAPPPKPRPAAVDGVHIRRDRRASLQRAGPAAEEAQGPAAAREASVPSGRRGARRRDVGTARRALRAVQ